MRTLGIEFNDASLTGVIDGELVFVEPGYAVVPNGDLLFGREAQALARRFPRRMQNRYWEELSEDPLSIALGDAHCAADLAHSQLASLWRNYGSDCEAAVFAVPSVWGEQQLGLLLGIAHEESIPVAGFVDCAVAATRREYPGCELLSVEARLHATDLSRMQQEGQAALAESHALPGLGVERLERISVEYFASCFLIQARFDPLHDAASEQALYDRVPDWLLELNRSPSAQVELNLGTDVGQVRLERDALAARITDACQPLLQRLRSVLPAGRATALQVGARLAAFPGILSVLAALPDVAVYALDLGAASRGAARALSRPGGEQIRLLTRLPWDQPPAPDAPAISSQAPAAPTHVLVGSRAYRVDNRSFSIGTELAPGEFGVALDNGTAGISRRHCSVQVEQGRLTLTDHSRYGTRLNGHPIGASAILQAGDVIGLGEPSVEIRVVIEMGPDGA